MNTTEAITILILIYGTIIVLIIFMFKWFMKNKFLISIDEYKDGVLLNKTMRGRFVNDRFFKFNQLNFLNKTKPLYNFEKTRYKNYFIVMETKSLFQPKIILNILIDKSNIVTCWKPPTKIDSKGLINNIRIVKLSKIRDQLWNFTDNTSKADMLYKFAMPMALVILALACLIFFPKIYDKIMMYSKPLLEQATNGWLDSLQGFKKPLG